MPYQLPYATPQPRPKRGLDILLAGSFVALCALAILSFSMIGVFVSTTPRERWPAVAFLLISAFVLMIETLAVVARSRVACAFILLVLGLTLFAGFADLTRGEFKREESALCLWLLTVIGFVLIAHYRWWRLLVKAVTR